MNNFLEIRFLLQNDTKFIFAKNDINVRLCSDTAIRPNLPSDYKLCASLKIARKGNEDFEEVVQLQIKPDLTGCDVWNVSKLLQEYLEHDCPTWGTDTIMEHQSSVIRFKICLWETWTPNDDFVIEPGEPIESEERIAILGGVDEKHITPQIYSNEYSEQNKPLTWFPCKKTITRHQQEYLTWFNCDASVTEIEVCTRIEYAGGGAATFTSDLYPVGENCLYSIPVGWCKRTPEGFSPSLQIGCYISIVKDQDGNELFRRNYNIICHQSWYKYFLFTNSLGGLESFHTRGNWKEVHDFDKTVYRGLDKLKIGDTKSRRKVQVKLGPQTLENCQMWWLKEFLKGGALKEVNYCSTELEVEESEQTCNCECDCGNPKKGFYCEILIGGGSFTLQDFWEPTTDRQFEYEELENKVVCTPPLCLGSAPNTDPCLGVEVGLEFELSEDENGQICVKANPTGLNGDISYSNDNNVLQSGDMVCGIPKTYDIELDDSFIDQNFLEQVCIEFELENGTVEKATFAFTSFTNLIDAIQAAFPNDQVVFKDTNQNSQLYGKKVCIECSQSSQIISVSWTQGEPGENLFCYGDDGLFETDLGVGQQMPVGAGFEKILSTTKKYEGNSSLQLNQIAGNCLGSNLIVRFRYGNGNSRKQLPEGEYFFCGYFCFVNIVNCLVAPNLPEFGFTTNNNTMQSINPIPGNPTAAQLGQWIYFEYCFEVTGNQIDIELTNNLNNTGRTAVGTVLNLDKLQIYDKTEGKNTTGDVQQPLPFTCEPCPLYFYIFTPCGGQAYTLDITALNDYTIYDSDGNIVDQQTPPDGSE